MQLFTHHSVARHFRDLQSLTAISHKNRVLWSTRRSLATGGLVFDYISDVERLDGYRPGGYHPIRLNEKLQGRYSIVEKLGHGSYSTIWLARDETLSRYVAIKIGIADYNSKEVKILDLLSARPKKEMSDRLIPPILDRFELKGPNGTHPCLVTTPARCSVLEALSDLDMFPLDTARSLAAQLAMAVACVHELGVVHGGWWPSNGDFTITLTLLRHSHWESGAPAAGR
jgi:serine/threonine-protein kinase SRPK3